MGYLIAFRVAHHHHVCVSLMRKFARGIHMENLDMKKGDVELVVGVGLRRVIETGKIEKLLFELYLRHMNPI